MQGLMQPYPLTLDHVFRRAERLFADKAIATGDRCGPAADDVRGVGASAPAGWAACSTTSGSRADGRVGTFAWNTARHLELYFAAPCSGRVLHTLNIRLFPEQLTYVVNHAEDEVIFADRSLMRLLWPLVDELRHACATSSSWTTAPATIPDDPRILDYEELLAAAEPVEFRVQDEDRAAAMCYTSGTTGQPQGRRLLAPLDGAALDGHDARRHARRRARTT